MSEMLRYDEHGRVTCMDRGCSEPAVANIHIHGALPQTAGGFITGFYCIDHLPGGSNLCSQTFLLLAGLKIPETEEEELLYAQVTEIKHQFGFTREPPAGAA